MALGQKTGGREAGTPNKDTANLQVRLAALDCDPIEGLARIAMNRRASLAVRVKAFAEIAHYVYPKRKAVEHTGADGGLLSPRITLRIVGVAKNGDDTP